MKWPSVSIKPVHDSVNVLVILRIIKRFKVTDQALINESHHRTEGDTAGHKTRSPLAAGKLTD